jgi:hypothetical protein
VPVAVDVALIWVGMVPPENATAAPLRAFPELSVTLPATDPSSGVRNIFALLVKPGKAPSSSSSSVITHPGAAADKL